MGGGDLNLKKSWHPHTMKNQEKVWKAEQAKNEEERKLNDLRKEIREEKDREELSRIGVESGVLPRNDDKKLEWMYKSQSQLINPEDYLLGRAVDKNFEVLQLEEKATEKDLVGVKVHANHVEHDCVPFSIRHYRSANTKEQVDLQRKLLEDPLMLIKQKEMESRRKILENPVKLKELHRILKTEQILKQKISKKAKSKKEKRRKKSSASKEKKRKHKSSYNSDSSDNGSGEEYLDKLLEKRYKKLKGILDSDDKFMGLNLTKLLDVKYETISKELDKAMQSKTKIKNEHIQNKRSSLSESDNSNKKSRRNRRYKVHSGRHHDKSPKHEINKTRYRSRSHSRECTKKNYMSSFKTNSDSNFQRKSSCGSESKTKSKLTEEEKEQRRHEMMKNAAWRDEERTNRVHKQREELKREEDEYKTSKYDKNFVSKQVRNVISNQTTMESRIRSNLNNIQRTSAAMNSKFTQK